jgi:hypothetical protein
VGLDARWRVGPFGLDPTVAFQWGKYDHVCACERTVPTGKVEGDASSWLFDVIGSYQLGPLLLELRGMYSPGNKASRQPVAQQAVLRADEPRHRLLERRWLAILALGVDYFNGGGGANQGMDTNIGYDRYGRAQFALRATYSITPALSVYGVVSPGVVGREGGHGHGLPGADSGDEQRGLHRPCRGCWRPELVEGDSSYLGTEINVDSPGGSLRTRRSTWPATTWRLVRRSR